MKTPNRSQLYHDHAPLRTCTPDHHTCQPRRQPPRTPITSTAILKAVLNGLIALQTEGANAQLGLPPSTDPATVRLLTSTRAFLRKHRLHKASHAALSTGATASDPAVAAATSAGHEHWWPRQGQRSGPTTPNMKVDAAGTTNRSERDVLRQACPGCRGMRTVKAYCELQLKVAIAEEDSARIRAVQGAIHELDRC